MGPEAGGGRPITDRVTLLADIAGIVSRSHDLNETLRNVVDLVAKRLDADVCSVYLSDPEASSTLVLRATKGLEQSAVDRVRLGLGEGLVGLVAESGEPLALDRAQEHPGFRYFPETGEERYESLLAAPLVVRGLPLGVLVVQTVGERHFGSHDVAMLQSCAQMIAPLVLNATLLELVAAPDDERKRFVDELARAGLSLAKVGGPPRSERNHELRGIPASTGITIGPVYLLESPLDLSNIDYTPNADADRERADLHRAVSEARRELDDLIDDMGQQFGPEFSAVFHTHIQILEDKGFLTRIEQRVDEAVNAVEAVREVVDEYKALFGRIEDPYFRERGVDVEDVGRRLVAKLLGVRHHNIPLSPGAVVVTDLLLPAHFAMLETDKVGAIVAEHGGATSHSAIFARTLEIPAVTGASEVVALARPGELAIVDGTYGRVYLAPDERKLQEYRERQQQFEILVAHLDALRARPSETRDGKPIRLTANVGLLADLRLCEWHGVQGVGLFRTELLALAHRGIPEEEEQRKVYTQAAAAMAPHPVTIRTLDLGGDKPMPGIGFDHEDNPQLGCRSIRLSLRDEDSLRAQLRAIARANESGNIRCLLPMISSLDELRRVRAMLGEIEEELGSGREVPLPHLPVGVMIEVPSAALIADALAAECDFFSIGTNDLTQYVLAVDRGNEAIGHLYRQLHPAVLRLIDHSARAASRAGIPVSVCGEMASTNPLAAPFLIGLGIGELSGSPRNVPVVKEIIRALDSADLEADARAALAAGTAAEVELIGAARLEAAGLMEHPDIGPWVTSNVERVRARSR